MPGLRRTRLTLTALASSVTALVLATALSAAPAGAATTVPSTPAALPAGIENLAGYVPANSCDASPKPGAVAFGQLLQATYGVGFNVARGCGADALSTTEHYDGRAVDWSVTVRNATSKAKATAAINWLLARDAKGNPYANARRLGVMYIIWDGKIWGAYRPGDGWREYGSCSKTTTVASDTTCHRDHVHFSLSWEGANKHTSWWTRTVARPEFGPCRLPGLNWAPPRSSANYSPCPPVPPVAAAATAPALGKSLVGYSGMYLRQGSTGPATKAVQQAVGTSADGAFGPGTAAALVAWQRKNAVAATGVTDAATWHALIKGYLPTSGTVTAPATPPLPAAPAPALGKPGRGLDGDNRSDVLGRRADGSLWLYSGTGRGTLAAGRKVAADFGAATKVISSGDVTGDGRSDLLTVTKAGQLMLHTGNGLGGFSPARQVGTGWGGFTLVVGPGDVTGDGRGDLLARRSDGRLYLYPGTGKGTFTAGRLVGTGWNMYTELVTPGDFTGDGKADLVGRTPAGKLYLYAGTGKGTFIRGRVIGTGWQMFNTVSGAGDLTGDGRSDLVGRTPAGKLYLYRGSGKGGFTGGGVVIGRSGWGIFTTVAGVR